MRACFLKRVVALVIVLEMIVAAPVFADEIRVSEDLKHATGDHTVIVLNEEQIKDVERTRQVVLTDEQLKPLKAIYEKTPNKLEVLSSRWELCTCGVEFYGIWCRVGELDVTHSYLKSMKESDEYRKKNPPQEIEKVDSDLDGGDEQASDYWEEEGYLDVGRHIILDSRGDMYLDGKRISEEQLRAEIDEVRAIEAPDKEVSYFISFDTPPPISEDIDKRIHNLIDRVNAYCKEKDVGVGAYASSWTEERSRDIY